MPPVSPIANAKKRLCCKRGCCPASIPNWSYPYVNILAVCDMISTTPDFARELIPHVVLGCGTVDICAHTKEARELPKQLQKAKQSTCMPLPLVYSSYHTELLSQAAYAVYDHIRIVEGRQASTVANRPEPIWYPDLRQALRCLVMRNTPDNCAL